MKNYNTYITKLITAVAVIFTLISFTSIANDESNTAYQSKLANSHADGNSWTCNTSYYKDGSICRRVPANAYSNYNSNYWYCSTGYRKSGSSCKSAKANEVENDEIKELKIEGLLKINWKARSRGWKCKEGYIRYENGCYKEGELPQDVIELKPGILIID